MSLESVIREEAARLGFVAIGFAAAGPSRGAAGFARWLEQGCAGQMDFLARQADLRADPRRLLPEARSVVVAAARYPLGGVPGPYAAHARGRDYHGVLRTRLTHLARVIGAARGQALRARVCVDSAPLPEREWAVRAGLGWIGRQGSLVHPRWGCGLVLGELLVDCDLAPSAPLPDGCGECRLCRAACPTGALRGDGTMDARRCIAYLTVEHAGAIPEAVRPLMGGSLFGCDRCTAVCPFNPRGTEGVLPELTPAGRPGGGTPYPDAAACLALDEAGFERVFRGTAVYRSGLDRLRRNARLAAARPRDPPGARASEGVPRD